MELTAFRKVTCSRNPASPLKKTQWFCSYISIPHAMYSTSPWMHPFHYVDSCRKFFHGVMIKLWRNKSLLNSRIYVFWKHSHRKQNSVHDHRNQNDHRKQNGTVLRVNTLGEFAAFVELHSRNEIVDFQNLMKYAWTHADKCLDKKSWHLVAGSARQTLPVSCHRQITSTFLFSFSLFSPELSPLELWR